MQTQTTRSEGALELAIAYTDKPVSGWGGLVAVMRYLERLGLRVLLGKALPDGRTSPNQIPVVDMVLALFTAVLTGARRFAHVERLRADEVVRAIVGVERMPSAMTLTRYFSGFVRSQVEHMSEVLWRLVVERLRPVALGAVLDLDSTVFERYGQQEGSLKGYNPRKHGRPSHHPILAMLAEAKVVLHAWLRSGNTGTARGVEAFLAETLAKLPAGFRLYAVRADSGFFCGEFLDDLEARDLPYAIAVRMNRIVRMAVCGLRDWTPFAPGLEVAETTYQAHGWSRSRRIIVVREILQERPEARGRRLFEMPDYSFHLVVTTLPLAPADVWRFYNGRGDCENRLKDLKEDFGANGFCLHSFDGTEAVFRLLCFLYNLVADFKRDITRDESTRLSTLRTRVLVVGAILGAEGRTRVLRLGLRGTWQERFALLLQRVAALGSTVAHLANRVAAPLLEPPRPWQLRQRRRRSTLENRPAFAFN